MEIVKKLRKFGEEIYSDLMNGRFPVVKIPDRSTKNIKYDRRRREYVLGKRVLRRSTKNVAHLRSFTQLVWIAYFTKQLIEAGKTSTLRDVFYSSQAYQVPFKDQKESNEIVMDLEAILNTPREEFNIIPEERSSIFGDLTVEFTLPGYEGRRINLTSHPDGLMIGHALRTADFIETSAERVFVIEKGGIFTRFIEEGVHKRYKAILINTMGQAPRSTRYLIRRLNKELGLPVYIFTDADPWGVHISMVIISGSANSAHIRELATPDAKWIGVWATDIEKYRLPYDRLSDMDVKRLLELKNDIRYQNSFWQGQINKFLEIKKKSEQEAFAKYGLTFIVDKYLRDKMEQVSTL